jgi:hypothetical protein
MEYKTLDNHIMKEGEVMWRVSNTHNEWEGEPGKVIYTETTGYNHILVPINNNPGHFKVIGNNGKSPFPQKHFFDRLKAIEYLKLKN